MEKLNCLKDWSIDQIKFDYDLISFKQILPEIKEKLNTRYSYTLYDIMDDYGLPESIAYDIERKINELEGI